MTAIPMDRSVLFRLGDELRIIETSPAWRQVSAAIRSLEERRAQGSDTSDLEEQVSYVHAYEKLLRESLPLITDALLTGALVGVFSEQQSLGERVFAGLRSISQAYHFDQRTAKDVQSVFDQIRREATEVVPELRQGAPYLSFNGNATIESWKIELRTRLTSIEQAVRSAFSLTQMRAKAWTAFAGRASSFQETTIPSLFELWVSTADSWPTAFGFDPSKLSVFAWSDVWAKSLVTHTEDDKDSIPVIVAPTALQRLRWPSHAIEAWRAALSIPRVKDRGRSGSSMQEDAGARALVIRRERDSDMIEWMPDQGFPIIALSPFQTDEILDRFREPTAEGVSQTSPPSPKRRNPFAGLSITHLVVEGYVHSDTESRSRLMKVRELLGFVDGNHPGVPLIYAYKAGSRIRVSPSGMWAGRIVAGPESALDLLLPEQRAPA